MHDVGRQDGVDFLVPYAARIVYQWRNYFDAALIEREHPDVVTYEMVGRHLYGFVTSPDVVP